MERIGAAGTLFGDLPVDRLAAEAGVSKATFYIYYDDKADFLRQATAHVFAEIGAAAQLWWDVADLGRVEDLRGSMSAVVERRHERGVMRAVPTTTIAALAWRTVERTCMQELADSSPAVQAELADTFTEIIFTALYAG